MKRIYLGDSVYADWDGERVRLCTQNGAGPENTIILEPAVLEALLAWIERLRTGVSGR